MRSLLSSILVIGAALLMPQLTEAQMFDTTPITISTFPEFPRPYDVVTISPKSTSLNLGASKVTISANGAILEEGSGARSTTVVLGGPGTRTTVRVTVISGGVTYTAETALRPSDVALVLEPTTTTHPLYAGASLVAPEGPVRVVALADFRSSNGSRIAPNSLSYTWRLGNRILTEESGIGRSVLTATAPVRYRNADVSVTVTTTDDSMAGYAEVEVAAASPALYLYRQDPLLGIDFAHAVSGVFSMTTEEETFRAIPFHYAQAPTLAWSLNGADASSDKALTVRNTSSGAGTASVGATASIASGETTQAGFKLDFGASRSTTLFGF